MHYAFLMLPACDLTQVWNYDNEICIILNKETFVYIYICLPFHQDIL